jgi:hypothetical protein
MGAHREQLKAMDVYADHRLPFSIAAWCREHRFHPHAANLARILKESNENTRQLQLLEKRDAAYYNEIKGLVNKIEAADAAQVNVKHGVIAPPRPGTGIVRRVKADANEQ